MKNKLYPNMKRITTVFCIVILCATLSVLALRLTVFSDRATAPGRAVSGVLSSTQDGYQINEIIYFSSTDAKGDVFITNLSAKNLIKVDVTLADTGESILTTGHINPGTSVPTTRMNPFGQQLKDGKYSCIAQITACDPSDMATVVGTATMKVEVYIGQKPEKQKA